MTPEDADALLVDGVCALEDYASEHQRACEKLKQGFFKLTMARRHLAPHALSDLSYHEFFDAVTVAAPSSGHNGADGGDDDANRDNLIEAYWRLTSPDSDASASSERSNTPAAALTQRKGKGSTDTDVSEAAADLQQQQERERQNATILWFSSLPPSDLRQAQTHFRSALQALLYAAASASKVQRCVHTLHEP